MVLGLGPRVVVALGGNAITAPGEEGTVAQDYENLYRSLAGIVTLLERGHQVILTHGNGPQVGNQMIRVEMALGHAPDLPLSVMVADVQGGLGYMMEQVLRNMLHRRGLSFPVCCLITLVEVDREDPALKEPTKFVGPVLSAEGAARGRDQHGWEVAEDTGRGWRRVVPSPEPLAIVEGDVIARLVDSGALVICAGGGGVPVVRETDGDLSAVGGVVDKDLASAVLATGIGARELYVLTGVAKVALDYGKPSETLLDRMTVSQARSYLRQGQFPRGSMGPKVDAACRFVEQGGERALITDIYSLLPALDGETGTWVLPDPP
ncbi:MAG: carbamate kinase [Acidobacteria bacterium]|nr:carbamate kinase [Acidobacteriota bacterium]